MSATGLILYDLNKGQGHRSPKVVKMANFKVSPLPVCI